MRVRRLLPWLLGLALLAWTYRFFAQGLVQATRDLYAHDFPDTYYLVTRWRSGELPLWLPNARMGQPFLALLYTQVLYLPRVLTGLLFGPIVGPNVMHALHAASAFAGTFLAARKLGLRRWSCLVAAAPFSLSPFFTELAQNLSFASSASWAGWILLAALHVRSLPGLRSASLLAAALGASFLAGAPEMFLWQAMLVVIVLAHFRSARARSRAALSHPLMWGLVAIAWAFLAGLVVALPAAELVREWTRPGEAPSGIVEWSTSFQQLVSLGVPDADLPRAGPYWGGADQRFIFSLFIGATTIVLALRAVGRRSARPFVAFAALCLLLTLGRHFIGSELLLHVPPFRFFRYPAKYAIGLIFSLSVLAGLGAQALVAGVRRSQRRSAAPLRGPAESRAAGPPVFLAGVAGVVIGLLLASKTMDVREGLTAGMPSALLVTVAIVVCVMTLGRRAGPALSLVLLAELVLAPAHVWPRQPVKALERPSPIAAELRAHHPGRVSIRVDMDDTDLDWCSPQDLEDAGDAIVRDSRARLSALRFVEEDLRTTGGYGFRDPWRLGTAFRQGRTAFALAGVTHFVRNSWESPPFSGPVPHQTAFDDVWLWSWPEAFPRSFVVNHATVATDEVALAALAGPADRFKSEVLLSEGEPVDVPPCVSKATQLERRPEVIEQTVDACAAGYVVLADAWFPGWRVTVDGVAATPVRADYFLRAVRVPAGHHELRWEYAPTSFRVGAWLSGLAWLAMIGARVRRRSTK